MNQKTLNAMNNCSALFLRWNVDGHMCYKMAKLFVETYEREEHEQHDAVPDSAQRALPPEWSDDKQKAYTQLASAVFEGGSFDKIQKAAKTFVEICKREEREKKPKPDRAWSPEKHQAYHRLLDDFIHHEHYDEIVADARRLAAVCEREEHEQPEVNKIYRDIFGNRYIVFNENFCGVKNKPYVALARVGTNGEPIMTDLFTVPLEDFMNPTFKKE